MLNLFQYGALGSIGAAILVFAYSLGRRSPSPPSLLGLRGLKRQRMMEQSGLFRTFEPAIRFLGMWIGNLPLDNLRRRIAEQLRLSGEHLGVGPNELIAMSVLSAIGSFAVGLAAVNALALPVVLAVFVGALGATLPHSRVSEATKKRFTSVETSLVGAIDLASLSMGAGLDFPGALRQVVSASPRGSEDPLTEELQRILQELELGYTRRQALEGFAERVPVPSVKDFVSAVVQAEAKGTPIAEVLKIQGGVLRMHKSTQLEEHAAKAAMKLMGPLMLVFICVIVVLMGPMVIKLSKGGL